MSVIDTNRMCWPCVCTCTRVSQCFSFWPFLCHTPVRPHKIEGSVATLQKKNCCFWSSTASRPLWKKSPLEPQFLHTSVSLFETTHCSLGGYLNSLVIHVNLLIFVLRATLHVQPVLVPWRLGWRRRHVRSVGVKFLGGFMVRPRGDLLRFDVAGLWKRSPANTSGRALLQLGQLGELLIGHSACGLGWLHVCFHLLQVPLELRSPVLKPSYDLCICQTKLLGDLVPVCRAQVLLVQEALLQLVDLVVGKRGAGLPSLLRRVSLAKERQTVSA